MKFSFLLPLLLAGALPLIAGPAAAPPQPMPRNVKVLRGQRVDVPLGIFGAQGNKITFVIRSKPEHGSLAAPVETGRETATAAYQSPTATGIVRDHFTYAAQSPAGVSAPADVWITIVDLPAALQVPSSLDFGKIFAGATQRRTIELYNSGGQIAEGKMEIDPPWSMEAAPDYQVPAGEKQSRTVVFAPTGAGSFTGQLRFSSLSGHFTVLTGEAAAALEVSPAEVRLQSTAASGARSAQVALSNLTDGELTVEISADKTLEVPASLKVPAGEKRLLTVSAAPGESSALRGAIHFKAHGMQIETPVTAAALGASLRGAPEPPSFRQEAGGARTAAIAFTNVGGVPGVWICNAPPPFEVSPVELRLAAGETQKLDIHVPAGETGKLHANLKLSNETQTVEVALDAPAAPAPPPLPALRPSLPRQKPASRTPMTLAEVNASPIPTPAPDDSPESSPEPPAAGAVAGGPVVRKDVRVTDVHPTEATLTWPSNVADTNRYRLEERKLSLGAKHALKIDWMEHTEVDFRSAGGQVIARLRDLQPGRAYAIRVTPLGSAPLFVTEFGTPLGEGFLHLTRRRLAGGALLLLIAFFVWQRFRAT